MNLSVNSEHLQLATWTFVGFYSLILSSCRISDDAKQEFIYCLSSMVKVCMALNWNAFYNM